MNQNPCSLLCLLGFFLAVWAASLWGYLLTFAQEKEYLDATCEVQSWRWMEDQGMLTFMVAHVELQERYIPNQTASFPCPLAPMAVEKRSNCPLHPYYSFHCYWKNNTDNRFYTGRPTTSIFLLVLVVLLSITVLAYLVLMYCLCKIPAKKNDDVDVAHGNPVL